MAITQTTVYLPNILLDESNYPTWLFRLESFLRGQNLFGFVDGSTPCPPQYITAADGTQTVSSEFVAWKTQDQSIVNMLGQTLSPIAMSCAVGSRSAHEMWSNLRLKFAAPNRQNILQLKSTLQGLKKGSDNIETYLDKIKAADALETVGVFLDDEDIVVTVLRGLPSEFAAIKTVIRAQFVSCSMGELKTLLKAAEVDIENEPQAVSLTAMVAQSSTPYSQSSAPTAPTTPSTPASTHSVSPTVPHVPPGFSPLGSPYTGIVSSPIPQPPYAIPAMPYGYPPFTPFHMLDPNLGMTGFFAGRGRGRFGGSGRGFPTAGRGFAGGNYNTGDLTYTSNMASQSGNTFSCQLCGKAGHGARTCRTLSQYQPFMQPHLGVNSVAGVECQYCKRKNHTADRCYHIIGFPNQQQPQPPLHPSAMYASSSTPQFWLADSGATNHMTSEVQLLNNVAPYTASDTVQVGNGQGAGKNPISGTE